MTLEEIATKVVSAIKQLKDKNFIATDGHGSEVWLYVWEEEPGKLSATIKSHHNTGGIPDYRIRLMLDKVYRGDGPSQATS